MKKTFTLVGLVIAFAAVLAAILFPVIAQAKLAAKKTADLSNLKQILTSTEIEEKTGYKAPDSGAPRTGR